MHAFVLYGHKIYYPDRERLKFILPLNLTKHTKMGDIKELKTTLTSVHLYIYK